MLCFFHECARLCKEEEETRTRNTALRAGLAITIFVLGSLQAWDSDVPEAGLLIVFLVSLAIALPPVALLMPLTQTYFMGGSFLLMLLARVISPIPLPGLFIALVPAVMGLISTDMTGRKRSIPRHSQGI